MKKEELQKIGSGILFIICNLEGYIRDFKSISGDEEIKIRYRTISRVYMEIIVINFSKLINGSGSDKYSIKQLKNNIGGDNLIRIEKIEEDNEDLFCKIKNNRNRLFGHLDLPEEIGLSEAATKKEFDSVNIQRCSEEEILRLRESFIQLISKDKKEEQYRLEDFMEDISSFELILMEFKSINFDFIRKISQTK